MSLKGKLVTAISSFCAVIMLLMVGVWAVGKANIELSGQIEYIVIHVNATITGSISGAKDTYTLNPLVYTDEEAPSPEDLATWQNNINFVDDEGSEITMTVTITNNDEEYSLYANFYDLLGEQANMTKSMTESGAKFLSGETFTIAPTESKTFTIKYNIIENELSANGQYSYRIVLRDENAPVYSNAFPNNFTFDQSDYTATVGSMTWTNVEKVEIPDRVYDVATKKVYTVDTIGDSAFNYNSSLISVEIPASVTNIASQTFWSSTSLTTVVCRATTPPTAGLYIFGVAEAASLCSLTNGIFVPAESVETYKTADGWSDYADKIYAIGTEVLTYSISGSEATVTGYNIPVADLVIPEKVTVGTTEYTVTALDSSVFSYSTSLTSVEIPASVTNIASQAFWSCSSLATVVCHATTPPTAGSYIFGVAEAASLCPLSKGIFVPVESVEAYKTATGWSDYADKIYGIGALPSGTTTIDNLTYSYDANGEASVTAYSGSATEVTIPSSITVNGNSYTVTAIDNNADGNLVFGVFFDSSLQNINIPNTVKTIGAYTFYMSKLTSVVIPEGVTGIGNSAFSNCESLTSIVIPEGVTRIEEFAFSSCTSLSSVVIPEGVTSIGNSAFTSCKSLTSIVVPDTVINIGSQAFYSCSNLRNVYIGEKFSSIGYETFVGCNSLKYITVSPGNTTYDSRNDCNAIIETATNTLIVGTTAIPNSVKKIGYSAFEGRRLLNSIEIPEGVTEIGDYAFSDCFNLEKVIIPSSVTTIGDSAFRNCANLTNVVILEGVENIGDYAFHSCENLEEIEMPSSVTSIGSRIFYGCTSLTSIVIPEGVTSIGEFAFSNCASLTSIVMPDGIESIGKDAFYYCISLKNIIIPSSVTSIGDRAFYQCSNLATCTINRTTPPTLGGSSVFDSTPSTLKIYVPSASESTYEGATNWSEYASKIYPIPA